MSLPFDIRLFAASCDDGDDGSPGSTGSPRTSHTRPVESARHISISRELVLDVQRHDIEAFRTLVQRLYTPLVRYTSMLVHSRDVAEDVVQEVFANVWELGTRWTPKGDVAAYFFAGARNRALNELRRQARAAHRASRANEALVVGRRQVVDDRAADALAQTIDAEVAAMRETIVARVLESLTERQRSAYDLRYRRGLTIPAIAEVLGITPKSAEQLVGRVTHTVWERVQEALRNEG